MFEQEGESFIHSFIHPFIQPFMPAIHPGGEIIRENPLSFHIRGRGQI